MHRPRSIAACLAVAFSVFVAASGAVAQDSVGRLKTVEGEAFVVRDEARAAAEVGAPVALGDRIVTGSDGAVGVTFKDNTMVSVGPDTDYAIDAFVFQPRENKLAFVSRVSKGTLHFVSGTIAKLAPDKVKVATPTGTIGVRGTRFVVKVAE